MALIVDLTREQRMGEGGGEDRPEADRGLEEFSPAGGPGDDLLTRNLKRVYEQIAAEPIPSEWLALLEQLDKKAGEP